MHVRGTKRVVAVDLAGWRVVGRIALHGSLRCIALIGFISAHRDLVK